MKLNIALLPGDGVGPEVTAQAVKCLQAVEETFDHTFVFKEAPVGAVALEKKGNPLPPATLRLCREADAVLFGTIGNPGYDTLDEGKIKPGQALLELRKELGLYANIRPILSHPSLVHKSPLKKEIVSGTDFIIYRELSGGIYFGEKKLDPDGTVASDLCDYSEKEISRIAHLAFKAAKSRKNRLCLVDKANVMASSKLWRKVVTRIGESYPEVKLDHLYVDNAAMQIILDPRQFDVILTENLFGDILSDEAIVIGGSVGLMASASIGDENALFEPIHGSYPQSRGKNTANPIASILSAAMLLEHFGLMEEALAVKLAVDKSLRRHIATKDIHPKSQYGTNQVGDFIARNIVDIEDNFSMNDENIDLGKSTII